MTDSRYSTEREALRPCPFCGETRISLNAPNKFHNLGSINCPGCMVVMPGATSDENELIGCWNERAGTGGVAQGQSDCGVDDSGMCRACFGDGYFPKADLTGDVKCEACNGTGGIAYAAPDRDQIARAICCPSGCQHKGDSEDGEKCYCDTTDFNGSGIEKKTDAVLSAYGDRHYSEAQVAETVEKVISGMLERGEITRGPSVPSTSLGGAAHPDCPCKPGKCIYPGCTCAIPSTDGKSP